MNLILDIPRDLILHHIYHELDTSSYLALLETCSDMEITRRYYMERKIDYLDSQKQASPWKVVRDECMYNYAASKGHLDVMKWIYEHSDKKPRRTVKPVGFAIMNGHMDVVKWLYRGVKGYPGAIVHAVKSGDLQIIKWVIANDKSPRTNTKAIDIAAENGNLDAIKLLHDAGYSCTFRAIGEAAANGYFYVVKWLI